MATTSKHTTTKAGQKAEQHRETGKARIRRKGDTEKPRLAIYRSLNHIYAKVIDDRQGQTLVSASSTEKDLRGKSRGNLDVARRIGQAIAERALAKGIEEVVFDRGGYLYHGRIKALTDAARAAGLNKNEIVAEPPTLASRATRHDYTGLIGLKVKSSVDLVKHVEKGLAFTAVEALQQQMDLAAKEMAELLDIKFRTFLRRKEAGRLQPAESDRVLRASRLFARAKDLFDGDQEAARSWLMNPQRALGGAVPLEIAKTEVGAREVEEIIGRLEQGVFT